MSVTKHDIHIYLRLLSEDASPNLIRQLISIPTATSWVKGEINAKTKLPFKENGWEIRSNLNDEASFSERIEEILRLVEPARDTFASLSRNWEIELSCVIYYTDFLPSLHIDKTLLSKLSEIRASIDIDIYNLT